MLSLLWLTQGMTPVLPRQAASGELEVSNPGFWARGKMRSAHQVSAPRFPYKEERGNSLKGHWQRCPKDHGSPPYPGCVRVLQHQADWCSGGFHAGTPPHMTGSLFLRCQEIQTRPDTWNPSWFAAEILGRRHELVVPSAEEICSWWNIRLYRLGPGYVLGRISLVWKLTHWSLWRINFLVQFFNWEV